MPRKEFKTIQQQIEILKSRGLIIDDEEKAALFLFRHNYYRVSGYSLTLRKHDQFQNDATLQNIIDIYEFDHELRHILLKHLETIEVTVKSVYAYHFTMHFGPTNHFMSQHFTDAQQYLQTIEKVENTKRNNLKHEAFLKHFEEDLNEPIPLWAYVELFTISDISKLYSITDQTVKAEISESMGLTIPNAAGLLGEFLHSLTILRNICAHGGRLFNRLFEQKPSLNKKEKRIMRKDQNGAIDNAHIFGFLLIMRRLLLPTDFSELKEELVRLSEKYPFVHTKYYGFPEDWKEVL